MNSHRQTTLSLLLTTLLFGWMGTPSASEDTATIEIRFLGPIKADLLSLEIESGKMVLASQRPYESSAIDHYKYDEDGNHWIYRGLRKIGTLIEKPKPTIMPLDRRIGLRIPAETLDNPDNYRIFSPTDPNYLQGTNPLSVGRKTEPSNMGMGETRLLETHIHTLYLQLPKPLVEGAKYELRLPTMGRTALPPASFTFDTMKMRSEAVHINHLGFRPQEPKTALISLWAGSGRSIGFTEDQPFHVIDHASGKPVFSGKLSMWKTEFLDDGDAYEKNYSGTTVYRADFSDLKQPGQYRVCLQGTGCSYPFRIASDIWREPAAKALKAFYLQRSGIAIEAPYSTRFQRPRNFHPDDGVKIYHSDARLMDTGNSFNDEDNDNFSALQAGASKQELPGLWGGYHDAGDWDRRIQHLSAARHMLDLYESYPGLYQNLELNIPESGNALPDVIDETLWGIDFFHRLQTPDGGIRGGIESASHPKLGEGSWQESWPIYAYAPGSWSSYLYAATAARAARVLQTLDPKRAKTYHESAQAAFRWAEQEINKDAPVPHQVTDARNLAAVELYRLSGDKSYHDLFLATTAFKDPNAPLFEYQHHEQREAAWVYANLDKKLVDLLVQRNSRQAILRTAQDRMNLQKNTGFLWTKFPWQPPLAGVFSIPDAIELLWSYQLTGDKKYLDAAVLSAQAGLGANPKNLSYTTGIGHRYPKNLLHVDSRVTGQPVPDGITALGPVDFDAIGGSDSPYFESIGGHAYPSPDKWPVLETYWDVYWFPIMCEYTIETMAKNAYVWGMLAGDAAKTPTP